MDDERAPSCACGDPGCPCLGACDQPGTMTLYRIDMADETGTDFCDACGADALDSGVFTD